MRYSDPKPLWAMELGMIFVLGFLLATALCLGMWFLYLKPAYSADLRAKQGEIAACAADRSELRREFERVRAESQEADVKLRNALLGWGRCIRGADGKENAKASEPQPANRQMDPRQQ